MLHKLCKGYLVSTVLLQDVISPTGWTAVPVVAVVWTPLSITSLTSTGNCTVKRLYCNFL